MPRLHELAIDTGQVTPLPIEPDAGSGPELQPKLSPDGRTIAFRRGAAPYSDVYLVPSSGGPARRLTHFAAHLRGHAWSPSGRALVVSSDHEGRASLYSIDVASGAVSSLGVHDAEFPARAGNTLAFVQRARLSRIVVAPGAVEARTVVLESSRDDSSASPSPDGRALAFVSTRSGKPELWVASIDGDAPTQLTAFGGGVLGRPSWSRDGTELAVVRRTAGRSVLATVDRASGRVVEHDALGRIRHASHTADGLAFLVVVERDGRWQLARWSRKGEVSLLADAAAVDPRDHGDAGSAYYTRESTPGYFRLDVATGRETRVLRGVGAMSAATFAASDDTVWFARNPERTELCRISLERLRVATAELDTEVECVGAWPSGTLGELAVDRSGSRFYFTEPHRDDVDLAIVHLAER